MFQYIPIITSEEIVWHLKKQIQYIFSVRLYFSILLHLLRPLLSTFVRSSPRRRGWMLCTELEGGSWRLDEARVNVLFDCELYSTRARLIEYS